MGRGLLSTADLKRSDILGLLDRARAIEQAPPEPLAPGRVVGLMFFEESVRTRVGFDVAAARLGVRTTLLERTKRTATMGSPERAVDAVRVVADWVDVLCIRHPDAALVLDFAARLPDTPTINCGNGDDEHPTQALIDLFAIQEQCGKLDGLRIGLVGNLLESRTAHSLLIALSRFDGVHVRAMAPRNLHMPARYLEHATTVAVEERDDLVLDDLDVVYVAGLQAGVPGEPDLTLDEQARFHITPARLSVAPPDLRVLCPLPRVDEIDPAVDDWPQAGYFEQSRRGATVRSAILERALGC